MITILLIFYTPYIKAMANSLMRTLQRVADAAGDWDKLLGECAEKLHQIALMQLLPQKSSDNNEHFHF